MKKINLTHFSNIGVLSYVVLITIGLLTTTSESRALIEPIRVTSAISVVLIVSIRLLNNKLEREQVLGGLMLIIAMLIGFALAVATKSIHSDAYKIVIDWTVLLCGLFLLDMSRINVIEIKLAKFIFLYGVLGLIVTLIIGGLSFSPLPVFNYDYIADLENTDFAYSLGMSNFMAMISIVSIYISAKEERKNVKFLYIFSGGIFLSLSFFAGGRGDSLAGLGIVGLFMLYRYGLKVFGISAVLAVLVFLIINSTDGYEELLIVQRFSITEDVTSGRDILISQSMDLLIEEPMCLFAGCGFAYFQKHYSYDYGLYPHNILLEAVITYGLPLIMVFGLFLIKGLIGYIKNAKEVDLFLLLFFYNFLIALKSNAMTANWFLIVAVFMFAVRGIFGRKVI